MRFSDWSSDVCSSDLPASGAPQDQPTDLRGEDVPMACCAFAVFLLGQIALAFDGVRTFLFGASDETRARPNAAVGWQFGMRSEERRGVQECVRPGRCRGWQDDQKKKNNQKTIH